MRNYIVLDTETAPAYPMHFPVAKGMRVYDLAYIIVNGDTGETLVARTFRIEETYQLKNVMESAYYADKLPQYRVHPDYQAKPQHLYDVWQTLLTDAKAYNVKTIWAYNARFDHEALNATLAFFSNGYVTESTPNLKWRDIWDYAGSTICNTNKYVRWAFDNGFITDKGNPKTSAEAVFAYITKDPSYSEMHMAIDDVRIEAAILATAKRRKQKARSSMGQGWRDAAKIAKDMY